MEEPPPASVGVFEYLYFGPRKSSRIRLQLKTKDNFSQQMEERQQKVVVLNRAGVFGHCTGAIGLTVLLFYPVYNPCIIDLPKWRHCR